MKLTLASASPRRAEILRDAGMTFTVISSAVDETPIPGESPNDHVHRLACAKAELVAARSLSPAIVIGADTVIALDGQIIGKPRSAQVQFSEISPEEISRYLATDEPYDKAGAYAIQGRAGRYISRIEGSYFNVVGMPLSRLWQELTARGWSD